MKDRAKNHLNGSRSHGQRSRAIVVGNGIGSYIRGVLEKQGWDCALVRTADEAVDLLSQGHFNLVISTSPLQSDDPLFEQLAGLRSTVVYCQPGQGSCWYFPVMTAGARCFGDSPLSPTRFMELVNRIMVESEDLSLNEVRGAEIVP